jgi:uncharacterized protein with HEPN domain
VKSSPSKDSHAQEKYLVDMMESAQAIQKYMHGVTSDEFWDDGEKRDAVTMRIIVIGEAARHVNHATAASLPGIPFAQIRGMRNRITHEYERVDFREVWSVTQENIVLLIAELAKYFEAHPMPPGAKTDIEIGADSAQTAIQEPDSTGSMPLPESRNKGGPRRSRR